MAKITDKYPLLSEGYESLECPYCDKTCYPDAKAVNGTIIYNLHKCKNEYQFEATNRRFEIDVDGNLIE